MDRVVQIGERAIRTYLREVEQLAWTGVLPNLDRDLRYTVYRWKTPTLHEAIVLQAGGRKFTIELTREERNGRLDVIPKTRRVAEDEETRRMESCGTIVTTARRLIEEVAVGIFRRFGTFSLLENNCQDFCNKFLREIGMEKEVRMTDGTMVIVGGALTGIVGLSGIVSVSNFVGFSNIIAISNIVGVSGMVGVTFVAAFGLFLFMKNRDQNRQAN